MRLLAKWILIILVFTIPWENAITITGIGTLSRLIGFILVIIWMLLILVRGSVSKLSLFHLAFGIFVLFNILSLVWTNEINATIAQIRVYTQLFALVVIAWDLISTPKILHQVLQAYILGAYVSIGSTIINYFRGDVISPYEYARYTGAAIDANDLALRLTLALPLAWYMLSSKDNIDKSWFFKLVNFFYIPAALAAIILTGSRMGLFIMCIAIVYILGTMHYFRVRTRILILLAIIGFVIFMNSVIPQSSIQRFATIGASISNLDLGGRVAMWNNSLSVFSKHPLLGVGSGALYIFTGGVAHNTFISILAELGITGFAIFLSILFIVVYRTLHQQKSYAVLWLTVFLIWTIGVSTLTYENYKPTWLFLILIVISDRYFPKAKQLYHRLVPFHDLTNNV